MTYTTATNEDINPLVAALCLQFPVRGALIRYDHHWYLIPYLHLNTPIWYWP